MRVHERFTHLRDIERRRIQMPVGYRMRLNRLERPEPWPLELLTLVDEALAETPWHQYPDYISFTKRLGEFISTSPANIVLGAGIEEFIRSFMFLHQGKKVMMTVPTCAMFEIYARAFGVEILKIETRAGMRLDVGMVGEHAARAGAAAILLINPGQPFETCLSPEEIHWLCRAQPNVWVAVDEAYFGFGAPTVLGDHELHTNLTVFRTFSKAFGAAGIRLGYAVGDRRTLAYLDAVRPSGEVGALSMHVAAVLMHNPTLVEAGIRDVKDGRNWLRTRFELEGFQAWGKFGNSVVVEHERAAGVVERLAARGILVRLVDQRHVMITCGSMDLMKKFFSEAVNDFSNA